MVQPASIHSLAAKSIDNHEDFVSIDGEDLSNHEEPKDVRFCCEIIATHKMLKTLTHKTGKFIGILPQIDSVA